MPLPEDGGLSSERRRTKCPPTVVDRPTKKPRYDLYQKTLDVDNGMKECRHLKSRSRQVGRPAQITSQSSEQSGSGRNTTTICDESKVNESEANSTTSASTTSIPLNKELYLLKQPETRPITHEQLVNEVKGIYAGLVMAEEKCIDAVQQQSQSTNRLSDAQWQALIDVHRTLLHEHHNFFLASQHPTASPALCQLATKYVMPARMWRHGIHSFLKLLTHELPDSLDHMVSFVYIAYSVVTLLLESAPGSEDLIVCLDDLSRYRMAIEETNEQDRNIWAKTASRWYDKASPTDATNFESIKDRTRRLLADPDLVFKIREYSNEVSSSPIPENAHKVDYIIEKSDYMHALSRKDLQASLLSQKHLAIVLNDVKSQYDHITEARKQKNRIQQTIVSEARKIVLKIDLVTAWCDSDVSLDGVNVLHYLGSHYDFLQASHHALAPIHLRQLAKNYRLPERIWNEGLNRLLQQVDCTGSTQDMLYWLRYAYEYIQKLRDVAPDLELDWIECQKGLDSYRYEIEKVKSKIRMEHLGHECNSTSSELLDPPALTSSSPCKFLAPHLSMGEITKQYHPPDHFLPGPSKIEGNLSTLPEIDANLKNDHDFLDPTTWPDNLQALEDSRKPEIPPPRSSQNRLKSKTEKDLFDLRSLILRGWVLIGQVTTNFNAFAKVYGVLSFCITGLPGV